MALTFEEVEAWVVANGPFRARVIVVRTQEDGRTGYFDGAFVDYDSGLQRLRNIVPEFEQFSDRTRSISAGPNATYLQRFDAQSDNLDPTNIAFSRTATGRYSLALSFLRWNSSATITMGLGPGTKLYTGWGPKIGPGKDQALYTLAIPSIEIGIT